MIIKLVLTTLMVMVNGQTVGYQFTWPEMDDFFGGFIDGLLGVDIREAILQCHSVFEKAESAIEEALEDLETAEDSSWPEWYDQAKDSI